ncbi:MAG: PaaI family thioesterase [Actinomycetota bacterium]
MDDRDRVWDIGKLTQGNWDTIPFLKHTGVVVDHAERGYVKLRMPFEPNVNHVGMMYAGALFTLAEVPGGTIFITTFDAKRYYPIVKNLDIRFRRPAMTDITVEVRISDEEAARVMAEADANGKADYSWECELKDASGEVVAITQNEYQIRALDPG